MLNVTYLIIRPTLLILNGAYEHEIHELPPSVLENFNSMDNVTMHSIDEPPGYRYDWGKERDWYKDYLGFSAMARALWSSSLGLYTPCEICDLQQYSELFN